MKYYILFLFAACIFSCAYFTSKKYGLKFNEKRSELGLPILCESWESNVVSLTNGGYKWINPERSELTNKYFSGKDIIIQNDTLFEESNYIVGEEKYNGLDADFNERIIIRYIFKSQDDLDIGLHYIYISGKEYEQDDLVGIYHPEEKEITKKISRFIASLMGN